MTNPGVQWTARPTLLSAPQRIWAETGARPSWPQCPQGEWSVSEAFFERDSSGAAKLGDVAVLTWV